MAGIPYTYNNILRGENSSLSPVVDINEAAINCQASWGLWHRIWDSQSRLPERISIAAKVKHGSNYGIGKDALIDSSLLILLPWCIILAAQVHFPKSVLHYSTSYFSCTLLSTETYASNRCLFAIYLKQWHWKIQSLWQETEKAKLWTMGSMMLRAQLLKQDCLGVYPYLL